MRQVGAILGMHSTSCGHERRARGHELRRRREERRLKRIAAAKRNQLPQQKARVQFANKLRVLYRLTVEDYAWMLHAQRFRCPICASALSLDGGPRAAHVDHYHRTGIVRGILCGRCNGMLAYADDQEEVLLGGLEYLARFRADSMRLDKPA